jgi:hypothetical protein
MIQVTLPPEMWNVVGAALAELPYKIAKPVIEEILKQLQKPPE